MFGLISCFLFLRNKNTQNIFKKKLFLYSLKITFIINTFSFYILPKIRFLILNKNEILLFSIFDSFEKIFLQKIKTEI